MTLAEAQQAHTCTAMQRQTDQLAASQKTCSTGHVHQLDAQMSCWSQRPTSMS